jgi:hypothetical protein
MFEDTEINNDGGNETPKSPFLSFEAAQRRLENSPLHKELGIDYAKRNGSDRRPLDAG